MNPRDSLSPEERERYSRHLMLPEIGETGQLKLRSARILCVGAGGLGSPAAFYLAAAGVGEIGLVDGDRVELSNLQRQILHATADVGRSKTESAREALLALNPGVRVHEHAVRLGATNAWEIIRAYDLVVDGSDNFATRYLVNDACVLMGKPNVSASVYRFDGQLSVFVPGGPCYRCLFPAPPPPEAAPSCADAGVLGVVPGVLGTLQALEALKLAAGFGAGLAGRLVVFDALATQFREMRIRRDPGCAVCGENPTIREIREEAASCASAPAIPLISVADLRARLARGEKLAIIDVREPEERQESRIEGSLFVPLGEIAARVAELPRDRPLVMQCRSGKRSLRAAEILVQAGFTQVSNLEGGILAWEKSA